MRNLVCMRWWLAGGFALIALTVYWSLAAAPIGLPQSECDKCGHIVVYGVLMGWFAGLIRLKNLWLLAVALMALGICLEFLQQATGPRLYELLDIAANATGIVAAWLVAWLGAAQWAGWVEGKFVRAQRG